MASAPLKIRNDISQRQIRLTSGMVALFRPEYVAVSVIILNDHHYFMNSIASHLLFSHDWLCLWIRTCRDASKSSLKNCFNISSSIIYIFVKTDGCGLLCACSSLVRGRGTPKISVASKRRILRQYKHFLSDGKALLHTYLFFLTKNVRY